MDRKKETRGQIRVCMYCRFATEEQAYGGFKKAELDAMLSQFMQSQRRMPLINRLGNHSFQRAMQK